MKKHILLLSLIITGFNAKANGVGRRGVLPQPNWPSKKGQPTVGNPCTITISTEKIKATIGSEELERCETGGATQTEQFKGYNYRAWYCGDKSIRITCQRKTDEIEAKVADDAKKAVVKHQPTVTY